MDYHILFLRYNRYIGAKTYERIGKRRGTKCSVNEVKNKKTNSSKLNIRRKMGLCTWRIMWCVGGGNAPGLHIFGSICFRLALVTTPTFVRVCDRLAKHSR